MRAHLLTRIVCALFAAVATTAALVAAPLPEFEVRTLDDQTVSSATLPRTGRWLLLYVRPGCAPCNELLDIWKQQAVPTDVVTVIVGGSVIEGLQVQAAAPQLAGATWLVDPDAGALNALAAAGAPVAIAFDGTESKWTIKGMLPVMAPAVTQWVAGQ